MNYNDEILDLIRKFENKKPEIVFEWHDEETGAEAWLVINSLRGGAAGGGTRMRKGLDKSEVLSLAKTMEIKFTVSGPQIGGAKAGINFDPDDPRKNYVLKKWFKAIAPLLKNYYGTGGDLNIDEVKELMPITEMYNIVHPQEGVLNGFYQPDYLNKVKKIGQLRFGMSKIIEDPEYTPDINRNYLVSDLITGYGEAESVIHYYKLFNKEFSGKSAIIQGWGNVASSSAYFLAKQNIKIVGIIDKEGGVLFPDGANFNTVKTLFLNKKQNKLNSENMIDFKQINNKIWDIGAEIFIPAAASRLVNKEQIYKLINNGLELISCGANVPFADKEIFLGPIASYTDKKISIIPDFISNCAKARFFAYLMQDNIEITDRIIFEDVSETLFKALKEIKDEFNDEKNIMKNALSIAIKKLI